MIIAHTAKLDGYKRRPDGLIRLTRAQLDQSACQLI
jgi:hypothetical protein